MNNFFYYKKFIFIGVAVTILSAFVLIYQKCTIDDENILIEGEHLSEVIDTPTTNEDKIIYVDIKGAVKKPGVYEFKEGDKVIDAINIAGGLKSSAVTSNINLSKKLTDEMVIYIYSKSELTSSNTSALSTSVQKTTTTLKNNIEATTINVSQNIENELNKDLECNCEIIEINNCKNNNNEEQNNKININTASKEELMTLNGIGESKADSIIKYRTDNGNFETIESIINVTGISTTIYEKIKDYITV